LGSSVFSQDACRRGRAAFRCDALERRWLLAGDALPVASIDVALNLPSVVGRPVSATATVTTQDGVRATGPVSFFSRVNGFLCYMGTSPLDDAGQATSPALGAAVPGKAYDVVAAYLGGTGFSFPTLGAVPADPSFETVRSLPESSVPNSWTGNRVDGGSVIFYTAGRPFRVDLGTIELLPAVPAGETARTLNDLTVIEHVPFSATPATVFQSVTPIVDAQLRVSNEGYGTDYQTSLVRAPSDPDFDSRDGAHASAVTSVNVVVPEVASQPSDRITAKLTAAAIGASTFTNPSTLFAALADGNGGYYGLTPGDGPAPRGKIRTASTTLAVNAGTWTGDTNLDGTNFDFNENAPKPVPTGTMSYYEGDRLLAVVQMHGSHSSPMPFSWDGSPPRYAVGCGVFSPDSRSLSLGQHTVRIEYSGDTQFRPASTTLTFEITHTPTKLRLTGYEAGAARLMSGSATIRAGRSVALTATVSTSVRELIAPTGPVSFFVGDTLLGTGALVEMGSPNTGTRNVPTATLPAGTYTIRAVYAGDADCLPSESTLTLTVLEKPKTQLATQLTGPFTRTNPPQIAVVINGADGNMLSTRWPTVTERGHIQSTTATLNARVGGSSWVYGGSSYVGGVGRVNPWPPYEMPTGSVSLYEGDRRLDVQWLDSTGATVVAIDPRQLPPGRHTLRVVYSGDPRLAGSETSVTFTLTEEQVQTQLELTSSAATLEAGRRLTLTARVSTLTRGLLAPDGTVTFSSGDRVLATVDLGVTRDGVFLDLPPGDHTITATYAGNADFAGSSGSIPLHVAPASTPPANPTSPTWPDPSKPIGIPEKPVIPVGPHQTPATPAPADTRAATTVTLSPLTDKKQRRKFPSALFATVTGADPAGTVNVYVDGKLVASGDANALIDLRKKLRNGKHTISAVYEGDANHLPSIWTTASTLRVSGVTITFVSPPKPKKLPPPKKVNVAPPTSLVAGASASVISPR
jgi:hypothetical protein